jgi:glycogen debranching enzyme
MKTLNCYDCKESFTAASKDEMLVMLYEHYIDDHKEVIADNSEVEKLTWMDSFDGDWETTSDLVV